MVKSVAHCNRHTSHCVEPVTTALLQHIAQDAICGSLLKLTLRTSVKADRARMSVNHQ